MIPAHNEGRVIRRLLDQLIKGADPGEMDIIVVANGCTDDTAEAAASFGPAVRVLTLPVASARHAAAGRQPPSRAAPPSGARPAVPVAVVPRQLAGRDHSRTPGNPPVPVNSAEKSVTRCNAENCLTQHAAIRRAVTTGTSGIAESVPNKEIL